MLVAYVVYVVLMFMYVLYKGWALTELKKVAPLTLFSPDEVLREQFVPVEINLEGWPLFSRQRTPEGGAIEVRQSISTNDGRHLNQLWRATASHDFSLPGPFDEDVFVGVMALVKRRGGMPKDGKIRFSLYELIKVLKKKKRAGIHDKVRESLDRIASTIYYSENAFYVAENESLETYRFTLWTVHFSRAKSSDGRAAEHHTLKFDDIIVRSYNAGYLKLLDTDLYFTLKKPLAKALYKLVDQRRRGAMSWSIDVRELRDLLAMSKSYKAPSRIWEVLTPAHKALRQEKFLQSAVLDGETAHYKIHPDFPREGCPEEEPARSLRDEAVATLIRHRVWPNRARALVDSFGPEKVLHVLKVVKARGLAHVPEDKRGAYIAGAVEKANPEEAAEMAQLLDAQRSESASWEHQAKTCSNLTLHTEPFPEDGTPPLTIPFPEPDPATKEAAEEIWPKVMDLVSDQINAPSLGVWFESTIPYSLVGERLTLLVPNSFAKEYIESRFKPLLEEALSSATGGHKESIIECQVDKGIADRLRHG
jgi:hypothetical protein